VYRLFVTVSDESVWRLGTGESLLALSCYYAVHCQLGQVLSFIKWRSSLLFLTEWHSFFNHWINLAFQKHLHLIITNFLYVYVYVVWYHYLHVYIIGIQPLGRSGQKPELSQATGMALLRCILGKFLGVACHCFPPLFRCSHFLPPGASTSIYIYMTDALYAPETKQPFRVKPNSAVPCRCYKWQY